MNNKTIKKKPVVKNKNTIKYNKFESTIAMPLSKKVKLKVKKEHFQKSKSGDALKSPLALCIKEKLKKNCDVLATNRMILYYDCKFDRKNYDIVLGEGRIAMIPLPEEISKRIKDYEETGNNALFEFEFYIPKSILDESKI